MPRGVAAMLRATVLPAEMAGCQAEQYSGGSKRKLLDLSSLYTGSRHLRKLNPDDACRACRKRMWTGRWQRCCAQLRCR